MPNHRLPRRTFVAEMFIGSETGLGCALNVVFLLIEKRLVHWSGKA